MLFKEINKSDFFQVGISFCGTFSYDYDIWFDNCKENRLFGTAKRSNSKMVCKADFKKECGIDKVDNLGTFSFLILFKLVGLFRIRPLNLLPSILFDRILHHLPFIT